MRGTRVERGGYGEKIVEDFKYLGSTVQCNGECRKELKGGLDRVEKSVRYDV